MGCKAAAAGTLLVRKGQRLHSRLAHALSARPAQHPELVVLHDRVAALPGVKAYLESPLRLEKVNNNGLG